MRCATLSGSAPRRPRPPGDGSAPGRWPKTRPTRATRLDWRVYPWVSSFFIKGYLMQVKTNKVVVVLALPGKRPLVCPGLDDEIMRLVKALTRVGRVDVIRKILHARADHHARNDPPLRDHIEHGQLFSDPLGMVVEWQDIAQNSEFGLGRTACQAGCHDVRGWHVAVGVLVVLIDANALEAELIGEFEFIQVAVVERMAELRIVEGVRTRHPGTVIALGKILREVGPGHQMKAEEAHIVSREAAHANSPRARGAL